MSNPGDWLRERREELHLTRSGIERLTSASALQAANRRYQIRRGRLADLEEGKSVPDIFEVASLSECFKITYPAVLQAYGLGEHQSTSEIPATTNAPPGQWSLTDAGLPFSSAFQSTINIDETRLVPESAEDLGIPAVVRRQLDLGQFRLGIVAANDDTMGELIPAGSVVVIDTSLHAVEMGGWKTIQERPVYFVWHENGFSCSWCFLARDTLFVVPYPTSHQPVMIFKTPRAATVIGRVIHVWPPLIIRRPA
jgi:hypothetical protein